MTSPAEQTLTDRMAQASHRRSVALHSASWPVDRSNASSADAFIALLEAFRATGGCAPAATVERLMQARTPGALRRSASAHRPPRWSA
jgi:hypothetical protein